MAPIAKESEVQNSAVATASPNATQPRVQPVALEIAVTVNGARTVEGSEKREPFSETTQTVLVFGSGAVIRLNANVSSGQLLFLTNEKTKKEVVCQVVKSKNYRSVSGYVELEFTEPAVGFWGMRFPTDRVAAGSTTNTASSTPLAAAKPAPVEASKETPAAVVAPPAKPVAPPAPISVVPPLSAAPVASVNEAPAVVEEPSAQVAPAGEGGSEELRKQTARLQEQLSSMLFEETAGKKPTQEVRVVGASALSEASAKVLEFAKVEPSISATTLVVPETPKPAARAEITPFAQTQKPTGSQQDEEVKIPAWLEPLARNGATPVPAPDAPASSVMPQAPPSVVSFTDAPSEPVTDGEAQVAGEPHEFSGKLGMTPVPESSEQNVPSFSTDLFPSGEAGEVEAASGGSKKGLWIGLVAATVLVTAGGGWWYLQQSKPASANTTAGISSAAEPIATNNAESEQKYLASTSLPPSTKAISTPTPINASQPTSVEKEKPSASLAVDVQKIPSVRETRETHETSKPSGTASTTAGKASEPVEETRKTSFSRLRLAAPKVARGKSAQAPSDNDPGITMENNASSSALNGGLASSHNGPVAPVAVGGEVKPVQLISAVQPVYPQMARSQRVSGDVKIDALIDENGRVTGMKIVGGPVLLHQAAMDALRQWKYRPATLDGKAVSMHLVVTIQFRLQ